MYEKICISKDWYLKYGNHEDYINVDLPNDYSIGMGRNPDAPGGGANAISSAETADM